MSNYADECLKKYVKLTQSFKVEIKFKIYPDHILVYYYYDDSKSFDILQTIRNLNRYLQKCNMNLHWRTYANVELNDSEIFFNQTIKRLTRLNIKKR